MKLNHLNLAVNNVPQAHLFFEKHFGFRLLGKPSPALTVLGDDDGLVLTLSNFDRPASPVSYSEHFHIGFIQESEAQVDALYQQLTADGFAASPPRKLHGSWTFYCQAPGGVLIEVLA